MALHTGVTEERSGENVGSAYVGPLLNRVARLLMQTTAGLAWEELPARASLRDLGEYRLRDLTRPDRLFQLVEADLSAEFPPLPTLDARPNNLPIQLSPLIGRKREICACCTQLGRNEGRLLTLTGPGGISKTRLGLQVAAELLDDFTDGIFL
jgi:hypothetical protein